MVRKAKIVLKKDKAGKAQSFKFERTEQRVSTPSNSYKNSKKAIDSNYASYVKFNQEVLKEQFSI